MIQSQYSVLSACVTVICQLCAGIEGSLDMARMADKICGANRLRADQGGPITIVAGQVERLQQLPVRQVAAWSILTTDLVGKLHLCRPGPCANSVHASSAAFVVSDNERHEA